MPWKNILAGRRRIMRMYRRGRPGGPPPQGFVRGPIMLTIFGRPHRKGGFCDGLSRRDFLTVGGTVVGGALALPHLLAACLCWSFASLSAAPVPPAEPPKLAFVSFKTRGGAIHVMNADGRGAKCPYNDPPGAQGGPRTPPWSPYRR